MQYILVILTLFKYLKTKNILNWQNINGFWISGTNNCWSIEIMYTLEIVCEHVGIFEVEDIIYVARLSN